MSNLFYKFSDRIKAAANAALNGCTKQFEIIEEIQEYNQQKTIKAFQTAGVSESHFVGSTGYGYGDRGRDALDKVYAEIFECEDALVRHNFVSGTHALTVALFGVLRPGDTMLSVTGTPYDTLQSAIGITSGYSGSLIDFGIKYKEIPLADDGEVDLIRMQKELSADDVEHKIKMVYIQRSRGYTLRRSLCFNDIKSIAQTVKKTHPNCIVMLDNCYGEFVEKEEPLTSGVDLMAGSLIKNPGGGIAPTGGYIAGKKKLVERCSYRLTTPGTGKEIGATLNKNRELFMGAFHAPHVTGEALKTAVFSATLFKLLGFEVTPNEEEIRGDIIQVIKLKTPEALIAFCKGVQKGSAVDSFVSPEPDDMPGYDSKVIMAAGAFTLGASIELSADAPLREPYAVWLQGGLNFHSGKLGIMLAAQNMEDNGFL